MTEQDQDPTTPEPEVAASLEAPAPGEERTRRRPTRGQLLVAGGALVGVLAVASAGFALGRVTAGDDDRHDHPGFGRQFGERGPGGGPGMMPPGLPRDDEQSES